MILTLWLAAVTGWAGTLFFCVLWRVDRRAPKYLSGAEVLAQRTLLLREAGMRMLRQAEREVQQGYPHSAEMTRAAAQRNFAEADQLDPPGPPGGEPGRLSLVKSD